MRKDCIFMDKNYVWIVRVMFIKLWISGDLRMKYW